MMRGSAGAKNPRTTTDRLDILSSSFLLLLLTRITTALSTDFPRRGIDVERALQAVRRACGVTDNLQPLIQGSVISTVEKKDFSPVTVADFAVQALILDALHQEFPEDGFIAEEDSSSLLDDAELCAQVAVAAGLSQERTVEAINLGKSYETWGKQRPKRVWCLDPIDGTRGFLRGKRTGGQYAIALAMIEDGVPVIGVLGCPNLPVNQADDNYAWSKEETEDGINHNNRGCVFVASKGGGCFQLPVTSGAYEPRPLHVTTVDSRPVAKARFCIGVERYSDALGQCTGMAKIIHGADAALDENGEIILATRMDSQAKHGVIARAGAELYARLPKPGYVEWIWDHAAGKVVVEEAGGKMTDVEGQELDFSLGAQLSPKVKGVLMSCGGRIHSALVKAYSDVATENVR